MDTHLPKKTVQQLKEMKKRHTWPWMAQHIQSARGPGGISPTWLSMIVTKPTKHKVSSPMLQRIHEGLAKMRQAEGGGAEPVEQTDAPRLAKTHMVSMEVNGRLIRIDSRHVDLFIDALVKG